MNRPPCPKCHREAVTIASYVDRGWRIRTLGCLLCGVWSGIGKEIVPDTAKRTRSVIGELQRDSTGRFAATH